MTHEIELQRVRECIEEHLEDLEECIENEPDQDMRIEYTKRYEAVKHLYERDFERVYHRR